MAKLRTFTVSAGQLDEDVFALSATQSHYVAQVLRLKVGSAVHLCDGAGIHAEGTVQEIGGAGVVIGVHNRSVFTAPSYRFRLFQAVAKGEKMDEVVRQAAELGASTFIPLLSERAEPLRKGRIERWQNIAEDALRVSGRHHRMMVKSPCVFSEAFSAESESLKLILHPGASESLSDLLQKDISNRVDIYIGAEGGFTQKEVDFATGVGAREAGLGPFVLRTQSAGPAVLAVLLHHVGRVSLVMDMGTLLGLGLAALLTSTISAILGMAGGITLLGVMTTILPSAWVIPLHAVVQLSSNLTRTIVFLRHVRWKFFVVFAPFAVVGVALAAWSFQGMKWAWFKPYIGAFILLFLLWRRFKPKLRTPPLWLYAPVGIFIGFLTIYVGATGPFLAPFMLRDDFEKEEVIATKAVCQSFGHILKIPAFLSLGFDFRPHLGLLAVLVFAVVLGTLLGKRLLTRLKNQHFVLIFESVLGLLAVYLIGAYFWGNG